MAYTWYGMKKISFEEVKDLHKKGELVGYYKLHDDNTEAMIETDYDWKDIVFHYECGGEFGYESTNNVEQIENLAKDWINQYCLEEFSSTADFDDLKRIGIAFTTVTDDEIPIQVYANLTDYKIERYLEDVLIDSREYKSLEELIEEELTSLSFDELVACSEEELEKYYLAALDRKEE